jgi:hypothetical protein
MHEVQLFSLVIGAGAVFVIFGVIQFFCQSLEVRPAKRQRIRPKLSSRKLVGSINVPRRPRDRPRCTVGWSRAFV